MPRSTTLAPFAGLWLCAVAAPGQTTPPDSTPPDSLPGVIIGSVRDTLGFVVEGATVMITPGGGFGRTDSAGVFAIRRLEPGTAQLAVRRLGFIPFEKFITVAAAGETRIEIELERVPRILERVLIQAERQCERYSLDGILCRREGGRGHFIGYEAILLKRAEYLGDLLRDEPGFRVDVNRRGRTVKSTENWRCIKALVNGDEIKLTNPEPEPEEVFAIEVYQRGEYPLEYWHWPWRGQYPCTLVVYWTKRVLPRTPWR